MITFYFSQGPNPTKVALYLEESGLAYRPVAVDPRMGEQSSPAFLQINPNGKLPAIVDGELAVFDSNAILMYLAEKTGQFLALDTPANRAATLSWLMFVATGLGPFAGQCVHFRRDAAAGNEYALKRYLGEARRHFAVLDARLATHQWMVGHSYTIVDMAVWGWSRLLAVVLGDEAAPSFTHVRRHCDQITARPAAARVASLKRRFKFKPATDEAARKILFPYT